MFNSIYFTDLLEKSAILIFPLPFFKAFLMLDSHCTESVYSAEFVRFSQPNVFNFQFTLQRNIRPKSMEMPFYFNSIFYFLSFFLTIQPFNWGRVIKVWFDWIAIMLENVWNHQCNPSIVLNPTAKSTL